MRITLVDDGRARELSRMFGELAAECPRVEVRARAEPAVSGARDVVLIEGEVRVFRGFLRALRAAARAGEAPGLACALPGPSAADKHLAALARRTARPSHPLLERGFPGCVYFSADALSAAGELDAGEPSARAQAAGFPVRLAAAALVAGTAPAPTVEPAVRRALDELEFHARRAPRAREAAVLVLLSAPPAESGADGARVLALVERLALPRVLLAYPGEGGIALAEVLDGAPEATHYRVTRPRAPARALRAILSDYRVGHVLGLGLEAWPPHALRAIIRARRPLTVDLTFAPGVEPAPCPSPDAWLAGYRRALASTSSQVRVGRLRRGELRALAEARRPRPA
ncbi:MAG: hypothetical protein OZ921_21780 [Sorangiineae bacterium]|nr:hypothetical protein [Sorangiineae bacterium]